MAKKILVRTPIRLSDIDLSDFARETAYMAGQMDLSLSILTGYDGKGQRRLACDTAGQLKTLGQYDLSSHGYLSGILDSVMTTELAADEIVNNTDGVSSALVYEWGRFGFSPYRYDLGTDDLGVLLAQGLFHQGAIGAEPDYERVVTSIAEILYNCWDQATGSIRTKEYAV